MSDLCFSKLGLESSLSGEITDGFTLGASLLAATNAIDSKHLDVKGRRSCGEVVLGVCKWRRAAMEGRILCKHHSIYFSIPSFVVHQTSSPFSRSIHPVPPQGEITTDHIPFSRSKYGRVCYDRILGVPPRLHDQLGPER